VPFSTDEIHDLFNLDQYSAFQRHRYRPRGEGDAHQRAGVDYSTENEPTDNDDAANDPDWSGSVNITTDPERQYRLLEHVARPFFSGHCAYCGTEFVARQRHRNERRFCQDRCRKASFDETKRPHRPGRPDYLRRRAAA
jgi:hypothetical protein